MEKYVRNKFKVQQKKGEFSPCADGAPQAPGWWELGRFKEKPEAVVFLRRLRKENPTITFRLVRIK